MAPICFVAARLVALLTFDLEHIYKVGLIMERGLRRLLQNDVKILAKQDVVKSQ